VAHEESFTKALKSFYKLTTLLASTEPDAEQAYVLSEIDLLAVVDLLLGILL